MSIIEQVTNTITNALTTDLAEFLSERFGLDTLEVSNAVNDYLGYNSTPSPVPEASIKKIKKKTLPNIKAATSGIKTCEFIVTRGPKEGKQCGTNIRGSGKFCSKHKNRKTVQTANSNSEKGTVNRNVKAKCWVVDGTNFVVKSPQNKLVIGTVLGSKVVTLNDISIKKACALGLSVTDNE